MSERRDLLIEAADLVDGDRNVDYGDPNDDFRRTAIYWSTHIGGVLRRLLSNEGLLDEKELNTKIVLELVDHLIEPHDVAIMMMQLKHSRLSWSPDKHDHWADAAGYAACGWDCVVHGPL